MTVKTYLYIVENETMFILGPTFSLFSIFIGKNKRQLCVLKRKNQDFRNQKALL